MEDSELLSLKWKHHQPIIHSTLSNLRKNQPLYSDVTLACDGKLFSAHRIVLSTCSSFFSEMFNSTQCSNPIVVLKDVMKEELDALLDYMYIGVANVRQNDLSKLLKVAEALQIKGLATPDKLNNEELNDSEQSSSKRRAEDVLHRQNNCEYKQYFETRPRDDTHSVAKKRKIQIREANGEASNLLPIKTELTDEELLEEEIYATTDDYSLQSKTIPYPSVDKSEENEMDFDIGPDSASRNDKRNHEQFIASFECTTSSGHSNNSPDIYPNRATSLFSALLGTRGNLRTKSPQNEPEFDDQCEKSTGHNNDNSNFIRTSPHYVNDKSNMYSDYLGRISSQKQIVVSDQEALESAGASRSDPVISAEESDYNGEEAYPSAASDISVKNSLSVRKNGFLPIHSREDSLDPLLYESSSSFVSSGYTQEDPLLKLLRRSSADEPLHCPYCGKLCKRKDHLKLHVRVHTGEKPYQCPYCNRKTNQKNNLKLHIRNVHPGLSVNV